MTRPRIRVGVADDADRYLATDHLVWFSEVPAAPVEDQLLGLAEDQRFAAEVDGADPATYPGVYGVYPMTLVAPGPVGATRHLPCAGLTRGSVHPDHRRTRGLTAMMRHHVEQVHAAEGTHVSVLHASEPGIYGRHGYGLASTGSMVTLGRGATLTAPHLDEAAGAITTQLRTVSDPEVPARMLACHRAVAELGAVVGELGYYQRLCLQFPEWGRDKEPWRVLFARREGVDVGFAMFRRTSKWIKERPAAELRVWAVVGEPAAQLALVRRLVDFDLVGTVEIDTVGADSPLLPWIGGPRGSSQINTIDNLWVRLVDLPQALEARAWGAPCDVVVEVADPGAAWNEGTWRIRADETGSASVTRVEGAADLRLRTDVLAAAYLGGGNPVVAHRAGLVDERRSGAVAELWRAMRTEVAPTAAVMF